MNAWNQQFNKHQYIVKIHYSSWRQIPVNVMVVHLLSSPQRDPRQTSLLGCASRSSLQPGWTTTCGRHVIPSSLQQGTPRKTVPDYWDHWGGTGLKGRHGTGKNYDCYSCLLKKSPIHLLVLFYTLYWVYHFVLWDWDSLGGEDVGCGLMLRGLVSGYKQQHF